jgi:hypothetical protein
MARRTLVVAPVLAVVAGSLFLFSLSRGSTTLVAADVIGAFGFHAGELVHDFSFKDVNGDRGTLSGLLAGNQALVIAIRTTECPVSQKYGHRIARIEKEYAERGVAFAYLDVSPQDTEEKIRADLETFGFQGPYIPDPEGVIGALFQAKVSTEIFVVDAAHTLRYRGAVDDQFGITFSNPVVRNEYLRDALESVLAGEDVDVVETEASGCYLQTTEDRLPERDLTYNTRVSRIVQQNCVTCHREGGVGPFALDSYQQVFGFRQMIKFMVEERRMPPWFASPEHGEWKNDRSLSERDRRDLLAWIEAGAPEGDPVTPPLARNFIKGWQLDEEPDTIFQLPEPQDVPAEGVLDYRYVYVKTDFAEDKWIEKAEALPSAQQGGYTGGVTHHIIVYLEGPEDEERGAFLVGWAPGVPPMAYPEGSGKKLPKGAWLMFELHYTPNGVATTDQTMVGFTFADGRPEDAVETTAVATTEFEIPAHASNHEVVAEQEFERGGRILGLLPHMHLRGKAFRYELVRADGSKEVVLDVPNYDFNWQLFYEFQEPLVVRPGDVFRGRAWYDNSEGNPANPDPGIPVGYGKQSFEEMMFGFYDWIPERRAKPRAEDN